MRKLWQEFKAFAFKGNMIDLAVAVVIGAAFGKIIDSLVKNIFMPLISYAQPKSALGYESWTLGQLKVGLFLSDVVSFLIIAAAVFLVVVKLLGAVMKRSTPPAPAEPTSKECPYCLSVIPLKARRCGHCTSDLAEERRPSTATA